MDHIILSNETYDNIKPDWKKSSLMGPNRAPLLKPSIPKCRDDERGFRGPLIDPLDAEMLCIFSSLALLYYHYYF